MGNKFKHNNRLIGFGPNFFDEFLGSIEKSTFPPYNIVKVDEDNYNIEMALAGYNVDEIEVSLENNVLTVQKRTDESDNRDYLHKGIANRSFVQNFRLHEHIEVDSIQSDNGLLVINLKMVVPDEKKPKTFQIERK